MNEHRIFPRTEKDIGKTVFKVHPGHSQGRIKAVLKQMHEGEFDKYEFHFTPHMMGRCLYLRYYAVHNQEGKYLGCLEVAQDVTDIRNWTSEKRTI